VWAGRIKAGGNAGGASAKKRGWAVLGAEGKIRQGGGGNQEKERGGNRTSRKTVTSSNADARFLSAQLQEHAGGRRKKWGTLREWEKKYVWKMGGGGEEGKGWNSARKVINNV